MEFKKYLLSDLYHVSSGLSKKREEFGFGYDFLTFKEVFHNIFLPDRLTELANTTDKERESCSIKKGDVFLTRTSEKLDELGLSSVALKDYQNATFNGFTKRLRPKKLCTEILLPKYAAFYYRSQNFRNQITSFASMTTRASLNNEMISKLTIEIPPIIYQEKFIYIIDNLLKKEKNNFLIVSTLEEISQILFKRWFIDFEFPNEEGHPYRSSGGEMIKSNLGEIPSRFTISKANDIFDINIGKTPSRKDKEMFSKNMGVVWASIADLKNQKPFIFDSKEYLISEAITKYNVKIVPKQSVLLSFKLTVGRVAITAQEMATNEAIAHFNQNNNSPGAEYTYLYLKNFNYESLGNTSSIATAVNSKIIKDMLILVPNNEVLIKFYKMIKLLFEQIKNLQTEIITLQKNRDTLLPKLLSGEIEISEELMV
ncbi:restriction endonuclease subunit S [Exiguobacterium antarcticum]|uniref:Restriction endonuclease subunit S n=1 Tax=Exiguobacterium antarcticum TaxID=132920 RepID=A0ABT6R586_9BACL|nr:restriction endonuclease subunit S [Exiguobacterium antarcticum]MDI3236123.1 restriction endonuclease subunit S [Exiguobacterium antarcticum]